MRFYKRVYLSPEIRLFGKRIQKQLKKGDFIPFLHVITFPIFGDDGMLEIYPAYILQQKVFRDEDYLVVGLAGSRQTAFLLVKNIVTDCYEATKTADIRTYLEKFVRM